MHVLSPQAVMPVSTSEVPVVKAARSVVRLLTCDFHVTGQSQSSSHELTSLTHGTEVSRHCPLWATTRHLGNWFGSRSHKTNHMSRECTLASFKDPFYKTLLKTSLKTPSQSRNL